ncbi:BNR/Asp-box repeat protein [Rhodocollybia butyracea]|uniref:BNR/Asp-box repeat protein n=1 Tax=Rhodocollybia butyracea TaxID=206335 RepID=A0A9P5UGU2_9AGAR|nr:BNR/Asp-box repeat protein [Rhodocollybia butyracea]
MLLIGSLPLFLLAAPFVIARPSLLPTRAADKLINNVTIFDPPSFYSIPRTLYARTVLLETDGDEKNVLLATWENYSPEPPYFPIHRSTDGGSTWEEISRVTDQVNGWGLRYQPFLYELPSAFAGFAAGTILCAGNSIPADLSATQIDLYASTDKGLTWSFVSHIASGGVAEPINGDTPVWEPFLMLFEDEMIVFYSDQRDPNFGQKLVHQTSADLLTWGAVVNDVAVDVFDDRPGMTTVTLMPNGSYIMTYEFFGAPEAAFAAYYRISDDPTKFDSAPGQVIRATDGTVPTSSPYITWSPVGGPNGTLAVNAASDTDVYLNRCLGAPNSWTRVSTPESASYTRNLRVLPDGTLLITGGGVLSGSDNSVTTSSMDLSSVTVAACT